MRPAWRTGTWLALSAVLWIAVGVAGTLLLTRDRTTGSGDPADTAELGRALDALALTADQRARIDAVLAEYQKSVLDFQRPREQAETEFWNRVSEADRLADRDIAAILTEEQRRRYEDLVLGRSGDAGGSADDNPR